MRFLKWHSHLLPSLVYFIIWLFVIGGASAQSNVVFLVDSEDIDADRYVGIKGSPYFFDGWAFGNVVDLEGEVYTHVLLNYNGYTNSFEVQMNDRFIELDEKLYSGIEIRGNNNGSSTYVFRRGVHPDFKLRFVHLIYEGKRLQLVNDFSVVLSEHKTEDVGATREIKRFVKKMDYYLVIDGDLKAIKLKKKKILELLGHEKELQTHIKNVDLNLQTEEGLSQLLVYYEGLME